MSKSVLLVGSADGKISQWHAETGKKLYELEEENNAVMSVDYNLKGTKFATGGNDRKVRVYDDNMKVQLQEMKPLSEEKQGHFNRIFAVKFHPLYENILISGGWDATIQIYDLRTGQIENSITDNYITSESIDIFDMQLAVGCHSYENQIKLWDLRNLKQTLKVSLKEERGKPSYTNSLRYSSNGKLAAFGGYNENCFRIYEVDEEFGLVAHLSDMQTKCNAVAFSSLNDYFAFGAGDGFIRIGTLN